MFSIFVITVALIVGFISVKFSECIYWSKWVITYIYVEIYRRRTQKRFNLYDYSVKHVAEKVNFLVPNIEYKLESPQPETRLKSWKDEVFFYGCNSNRELLSIKINRRPDGKSEASLWLRLDSRKTYHLEKTVDFAQSSTDELTFSCGRLQLQCVVPMRKWRILFAGYLKEASGDSLQNGKMVYTKFSLLWTASSDIFDFETDISTRSFASGFARTSWGSLRPKFEELQKALNFYGQAGVIHGTVTINEVCEDKMIYLFGQRIRYMGCTTHLEDLTFQHVLGYTKKRGTYLHIGLLTDSKVAKDFTFGFVVQPDTDLVGIKNANISILPSNLNANESIKWTFCSDLFSYHLDGNCVGDLSERMDGDKLQEIKFVLNGEIGYGVLLKRTNFSNIIERKPVIKAIQLPSVMPYVVFFKEDLCQISELTGGKGSSLGKLTSLSYELKSFTVPEGAVITTAAYESFLNQNVLVEIKHLEDESYKKDLKAESVMSASKRVMEVIINSDFPAQLQDTILMKLTICFGDKLHEQKYAIRSSATGEDTEEMSAAGQMETFLGVSGINEILLSVKKCWASQFSYTAIEYKRSYGQCYNAPMAVVIQEMVPCDVAGVLFTCDPLTGNPTLMSISANYGLGESVVSGSEEPDMIHLRRDENDKLEIKSIVIGGKRRKIVMSGNGTDEMEISENEKNVCSLPEEVTLQLGYLAIKIENYYRSARDIEWGYFKNNLYIFQSRPITSNAKETTYEIDHEFDSPMRLENDFYSVSNVGEVMPKGMSPLGIDYSIKSFKLITNMKDKVSIFQLSGKAEYFTKGWVIWYNHFMFNVADLFPLGADEELTMVKKSVVISLFGRVPDIEEMYDVSRARFGSVPQPNGLLTMFKLVKTVLKTKDFIDTARKQFEGYRIPVEKYKTSKELFGAIMYACTDLVQVTLAHTISSQTSSLLNSIIFSTLGSAWGSFDETVYSDFAKLLKTSSDVESADIPSATKKIAVLIGNEMEPEDFKKMSIEEALEWLQRSQSPSGSAFREFFVRHGHRCLQEFDLYSTPWRETPQLLVQLLQSLIGSASKKAIEKKSEDLNELFSELSVPLGFLSKNILKLAVPFARKGVQNREITKSVLVKGYDEWRKGWRRLAELMVTEGRIPEEKLIYFFTVDEVQQLLCTRSPKVMARAIRRKRRFPILFNYKFPEIMKGFPKPVENLRAEILHNEVNFSMKGIPVSQGVAIAFARKAINIEEAVHIKPGEILITYSTDVGWTPYFPSLAGVVTELGGLISHGAVVSREFGIPCIAGLHGVTKQFQTGDYVLLDGNTGILQKLEPPAVDNA